ncbi:PfkB family carbohydrate kinase [Candidatus Omnitrophota bacterium]
MKILTLGTVALDTVKTPAGKRNNLLGGSATHFAMSARFFSQTHISAVIGKDFPKKHISFLRNKGVVVDSLITASGKTFRWSGDYCSDLNSACTLDTQLGVLATFDPSITESQKKIKNIFLANVDPDIQDFLLKKIRAPRLVGLDSMNFWISQKLQALKRILKKVDFFVVNDAEARQLSGETNLLLAAQALGKLGPAMVIIKKGEHGVIFSSKKFIICLPAFPVTSVVDPTGAGDSFAGGFMGYLSRVNRITDSHIRKALAYGTILASFNVEGFGSEKTATLSQKTIDNRYAYFRKIASW